MADLQTSSGVMTSSQDHPLPAWYRLLPRPHTEALPSLARSSSLSQHHLVHAQSSDYPSAEDGLRRNTVHFSEVGSKPSSTLTEYVEREQQGVNGEAGVPSPLKQAIVSSEMTEQQPHSDPSKNAAHSRENICLCPPDPKIPRPRNSFILFRQHQQASIIAQNPGIPNPEVSKIIGEQWRGLSTEAKEEWNLLAEEEKARHQQQYPGYRYHPRRSGRASTQSSLSGPSAAEPQELCPKCGGKPMNYCTTPTSVYTPITSGPQTAMGVQVPAKRGYVVNGAPAQRIHGQPAISPEHYAIQRVDPQLIYSVPPNTQNLPTPPSTESQDAKRRRFNSNGVYISSRQPYPEGAYSYTPSPVSNVAYPRPEPMQQVHPAQMPTQHVPGVPVAKPVMASPPRAAYPRPPPLQPVRPPHSHQRARSGVTLPPIETLVSQTPVKACSTQSQSSGVEAMIMSIPVLNKIRVLSQMSRPLQPPGPMSPKPEVRGAIIAIEGMDATCVNSMANSLAKQLEKEGKFAVKAFGGPGPPSVIREGRGGANGNSGAITTDMYLDMLSQWHKINKEMVDYITSRPGSDTVRRSSTRLGSRSSQISFDSDTTGTDLRMGGFDDPTTVENTLRNQSVQSNHTDSAISPKTISKAAELSILSPPAKARSQSPPTPTAKETAGSSQPPLLMFPRPVNSRRIPPPPPPPPPPPTPPPATLPASQPSDKVTPRIPSLSLLHPTASLFEPPKSDRSTPPGSKATPIALVPQFQLTTVDAASISMPIGDGFSPPAHWQWFATLWRGSVGPDVTIIIKGPDEETEHAETTRAAAAGPGTGVRDRTSSAGMGSAAPRTGVEIRLNDSRAVIVKTGVVGSMLGSLPPAGEVGPDWNAKDITNLSPPSAAQHAKELENWEKAKRRVGFEVEEFLRR